MVTVITELCFGCMVNFDAIDSLEELNHSCDDHLSLRERKIGNGSSFVQQCGFCGEQRGNAIPKKKVATPLAPFDASLESAFNATRSRLLQEKEKEKQTDRIPSPPLADFPSELDIRNSLIDELSELVDSYRSKLAEEQIVGAVQRFSFNKTIKLANSYQSRFKDEADLVRWFSTYFSKWFYVYPEVSGTGYLDREEHDVRIDFVIRPKPETLKQGIRDGFLGVEVKHLETKDGNHFHRKSSRAFFQAVSYSYTGTRWNVPEENAPVKLDAVFLFSNLSFKSEREQVFPSYDRHYKKVWASYLHLANHADVGEVTVADYGTKHQIYRWDLRLSGSSYISWQKDKEIVSGNQNAVNKKRMGNF